MRTQILLVEDDPQQSETIRDAINIRYPEIEVVFSETESDFYKRVDGIPVKGQHPIMVICDMMLPWASPSPDSPKQPANVVEGTFRKAGLRCWEKFRARADLSSVPWIYLTVLDGEAVELDGYTDDRTRYVQKMGYIQPLCETITDFLKVTSRD